MQRRIRQHDAECVISGSDDARQTARSPIPRDERGKTTIGLPRMLQRGFVLERRRT